MKETNTELLREIYVFIGKNHKALRPWERALIDWLYRVEKETGWNHFEEHEKLRKSAS